MYKNVKVCRACGSSELQEVFNLGVQPLANDFCHPWEESQGHAPLKVMFCEQCTNSQLSVVVDPNIIYSNYPYVTSKSQTMKDHFQMLWKEVTKEVNPQVVVEIGSNDGLFLHFCRDQGVKKIIGIDPATNLQMEKGPGEIDLICSLFNEDSAQQVVDKNMEVDLIVARHVFCHINDWLEFMHNIEKISNTNTVVAIEVPYVMDMLQGLEFDTIYHEHLDYLSIRAVQHLLKDFMFSLNRVVRFSIHGGAILLILKRDDAYQSMDSSVPISLELESLSLKTWEDFKFGSLRKIDQLQSMVNRMDEKNRIVGFGASAKSTVWINACGFTRKEIEFICDCTPEKQGKMSPGNDIMVVPESELMAGVDVAILFAWNFKKEILAKNHEFISKGGRFLIPDIHISTT
jgi:novobiocin biosynthesis protein NovU/D-mycarose 3-C-methyltransferase